MPKLLRLLFYGAAIVSCVLRWNGSDGLLAARLHGRVVDVLLLHGSLDVAAELVLEEHLTEVLAFALNHHRLHVKVWVTSQWSLDWASHFLKGLHASRFGRVL